MSSTLPAPVHFGAPEKFSEWRGESQSAAVLTNLDSPHRFIVGAQPTGFGKTLCYIATALLAGWRMCVVTSNKALQAQLMDDFGACGLVDIRGQNNYDCLALKDESGAYHGCDSGPCHAGIRCELQREGCLYFDAVGRAKASKLVVTNYSYWITQNLYGQGLGTFDALVLDEAHNADQALTDAVQVRLDTYEVEGIGGLSWPRFGDNVQGWRNWAPGALRVVSRRLDALKAAAVYSQQSGERLTSKDLRETRALKGLEKKLEALGRTDDNWIAETDSNGKTVLLAPVWPAKLAEGHLFLGIKKVLLVSATIRPKTLDLLGIAREDAHFKEYPSTFPLLRRPVILVQSDPPLKVQHNMTKEDVVRWVALMDKLIDARLDRKGIIHTVSYARRNEILEHSRHTDLMITHDSRTARSAIAKFKESAAPAILVSPSISTGVDFPMTECEYTIVSKVPFPDTTSKLVQARSERDKSYGMYLAAQDLVQMSGRGMRSKDDQNEVIIVDHNALWFRHSAREHFPQWFLNAWRKQKGLPIPLQKLRPVINNQ